MKTIIAIGGGSFGRDDEFYETELIDQKIIDLTGKEAPQVLFIPTASNDAPGYIELFMRNFGGIHNCTVDVLRIYGNADTNIEYRRKIQDADAIYVGGGNTMSMMKIWQELKIDIMLKEAYQKGTIISGLSAGAICWFKNLLSDYRKLDIPDAPFSFLPGLNFEPLTICPHYNTEIERRQEFKKALRDTELIGFGIDDNAAMILQDGNISMIQSKSSSQVWMCFWKNGRYWETPLEDNEKIGTFELDYIKLLF
ncbi:Type 1 glutamine amidotransferase-like domain-containing protein [Spirochaeta dissipatitropha]